MIFFTVVYYPIGHYLTVLVRTRKKKVLYDTFAVRDNYLRLLSKKKFLRAREFTFQVKYLISKDMTHASVNFLNYERSSYQANGDANVKLPVRIFLSTLCPPFEYLTHRHMQPAKATSSVRTSSTNRIPC